MDQSNYWGENNMEQVKQFKKYAYLALMFAPLVVSLFVVWFLPETIVSRMVWREM